MDGASRLAPRAAAQALPCSNHVVAIDVGGTAIKGALIDVADIGGDLVLARSIPTPAGDPSAIVQAIRDLAGFLCAAAGGSARAVGVVVPGVIDAGAGIARYAANLGWRDVPLGTFLGEDTNLPVALGHDVGAAALAERELGAAAGLSDHLVVVIGTGIAAVSVLAGQVRRGANGQAGELGHIPIRPGAARCACGQRGCLEAYASARAIGVRYQELTGTRADAAGVRTRASTDPAAAQVWNEAVAALADALATVTMLDDPAAIVIAGGLAEAGDALFAPLRRELAARLTWREPPAVLASRFGAGAGRRGAALLAQQTLPARGASIPPETGRI